MREIRLFRCNKFTMRINVSSLISAFFAKIQKIGRYIFGRLVFIANFATISYRATPGLGLIEAT